MIYETVLGLLLLGLASSANAANLSLAQNYSGATFFDGWTFVAGTDNNFGNVLYQGRQDAMAQQLAFINSAGNAIIKVDNVTNGVGNLTFGRNSINITSNATVPAGSLVIMDAVHMPFGCSVWPAFWMQGPDWPNNGEIDIVENVNAATVNRYNLHTLDGCMHPAANASTGETGTVVSTDCFNQTNGDEGCIVNDPSTNSYGQGFASSGGGVFAMLWDDTGIKFWSFSRASIPSDVPTANPDPSSWPTPVAFYPSTSCNTAEFFSAQTLIIDISICGGFAGSASVFSQTCSGDCLTLVGDPANYNNAYFEISYIHVFTNGTAQGTTPGSTNTPNSGGGSNGGGSGGSGSSSGASWTRPLPAMTAFLQTVAAIVLLPAAMTLLIL